MRVGTLTLGPRMSLKFCRTCRRSAQDLTKKGQQESEFDDLSLERSGWLKTEIRPSEK